MDFWFDLAVKFGLPFALVCFFVFAQHKGWVVMGRSHDRIIKMWEDAYVKSEARADKWETRAQGLLEAAASSAQAAERAVRTVSGEDETAAGRRRRGGGV